MVWYASYILAIYFFFFFSSRRRHTRWTGDWSSDVCSSDLLGDEALYDTYRRLVAEARTPQERRRFLLGLGAFRTPETIRRTRSEERRVGKECRCGWVP